MPRSRTFPLLLAMFLLAGGAVPSGAQQASDGLFSITPSSQTVVDRPPAALETTVVRNTTDAALEVRVFPVLLGQQIDGAFTFSEAPRDLNAAAKILTPNVDAFTMEPGTSRNIGLRWNLLPVSARAAFLGVVFESKAKPAPGQQVKTIQRLLTVDFLRLPGRFRNTGELTRLRASQGPEKTLLFYPRVKNTGEFVGSPRNGKFRIRNAEGEIVFQTEWEGNVILPDHEREFAIEMRKVLPAGEYGAVATADFGSSRGLKIIERFTLVGPNQLPTGRVTIENFRGEGVLGGDSRVTGVIKSVGTAPAKTAIRLDLFRLLENGQQPENPLQTKRLEFNDPIAPGETVTLAHIYPDLPAGDYRVRGTYRAEEGSIEEVVTDFAPQKERSAWQKFKDWLRDNKGLFIGLGVLLLVALLAYFLRRQRRLQLELEEARSQQAPQAAPTAPAEPAVALPPSGVDINTASLQELQSLPGIGPKAAERIVAHREEHGAFGSLDDLAAVEGFGAKRVEGLRAHARV